MTLYMLTLYEKDLSQWQQEVLSYDEECLTSHMKVFLLKWASIRSTMQRKGQVDEDGYVWISYGYIAKGIGCGMHTARRLVQAMHHAQYLDKKCVQVARFEKKMAIKMLSPVLNAEFSPLPTTKKGKGQKNYACFECGSSDVMLETIKRTTYRLTCLECGVVHDQTKERVKRT